MRAESQPLSPSSRISSGGRSFRTDLERFFRQIFNRLARWLLMVRDRTTSDVLGLTREFLGAMIGARTTVTLVAGALQRSGLIEYSRGRIRIPDRKRLEEATCSCYPSFAISPPNFMLTSTATVTNSPA